MPSIVQLQENSVPVVLNRFQFILSCQTFVERMTPTNTHLVALEEQGEALDRERQLLVSKHRIQQGAVFHARALFDDPELLAAELQKIEAPKTKPSKKAAEETATIENSPFELLAARSAELQQQVADAEESFNVASKEATQELAEIAERIYKNACQRVAHLLKSWDLTDEKDNPIAIDAEVIESTFAHNQEIIMGWLERTGQKDEEGNEQFEAKPGLLALIEAAKDGPLEIASNSIS